MTLKVYKVNNHWFFTYKNVEIQLKDDIEVFVNCIGNLNNSDIIYFEIIPYNFRYPLALVYLFRDGDRATYELTGRLSSYIPKLFEKVRGIPIIEIPVSWKIPKDIFSVKLK